MAFEKMPAALEPSVSSIRSSSRFSSVVADES